MNSYIIFLRGVMPTGKNRVPMAELRQILTDAGLADVRTYIQSGNVLASSDLSASEVETLVHDEIQVHLGGEIPAVARTLPQLRKIVVGNPFKAGDPANLYFTLLQDKPKSAAVEQLDGLDFRQDEFAVIGQTVYLHCPAGYGTSRLSNNFIEKKFGVAATTRNYRTMTKLIELSAAVH